MKKITLQQITLRNWRGEKERTTVFHTDAPTYICGDNGLGKSRHFDAFCWLLFGKDSQERKDFELRTYDAAHRPLHHCECSVEAVLLIDDTPLTLRREYKEQWVKPRGQVEEVFKGNVTECTWDGTPVRVSEFQKRVADEIISDTLFKMLTNPRYFAEQMKWQQQREVLMQMAGTKSDEEIAASNAGFRALLDELNGKPLADFRREIAATKKRLKADLDAVPTRIDEVQRGLPEADNWNEIEQLINDKRHDIDHIDHQLQDGDVRDEAKRKERSDINSQIDAARLAQDNILREARATAQSEADKKNECRRELEASLKKAHTSLTDTSIDIKHCTDRINYYKASIEDTDKRLATLREQWYAINASTYDEHSNVCPTCGQTLPEDALQAAYEKFQQHKADQLRVNNAAGQLLVEQRKSEERELEKQQAWSKKLQDKREQAEANISQLTDVLLSTPTAKPEVVVPANIPAWVEEQEQITKLTAQLEGLKSAATADDRQVLQEQKQLLQAEVSELQAVLAHREQIAQGSKRIAELKEQGRELAQQIADLEKREYIAAQFAKAKIEDCEQRINAMFASVRFQLFDYTQDGAEFECCIPLVSGVPYAVANTAAQLNAGLDIIGSLCRFNNVCAPIFIDGAESVNSYFQTPSQYIYLQVTRDKQLVVK